VVSKARNETEREPLRAAINQRINKQAKRGENIAQEQLRQQPGNLNNIYYLTRTACWLFLLWQHGYRSRTFHT
jgi:hypothetical protein